jgi:hypothetical protein
MIIKSLISVSLLTATLLQADYISTYDMDGESQTFMYHDSTHVKMINRGERESSSVYRIGKKVYIVSVENGKTKVVDMDEMKKLANSFGGGVKQPKQEKSKVDFDIDKTGKKVTVAGIKGEVWIVTGTDNGEPFKQKLVVTKDKRVLKTIRAQMDMFSQMANGEIDTDMNMFEIEKGYVTIKADSMVLKSFQEKDVAKSEYELPKDAQMQKMPDFGALFGGGTNSKDPNQKGVLDPCYNEVCCGKTAGEANVLKDMLKPRSGGYELQGSGVCDALGLSSLFGVQSVEGALYKKENDPIQVTLALDDSSGGSVATTKKQIDSGVSLVVKSIKDYKKGVMGTASYQYGMLMPMKQQTLDIIIDSKTILSITRIAKNGEIDLISWTKRAIDLEAFKKATPKKETKSNNKNDDSDLDKNNINENVDKAVEMFKSFF